MLVRLGRSSLRYFCGLTMARLLDPGLDALYAMHERWMADALGPGDSLFTPGSAIWTAEHLDELVAPAAHLAAFRRRPWWR